MGRLTLISAALLILAGCKPEPKHDLTPLEQAVAGFWEKTYAGFGVTSGDDLEHLERPNCTGHWYVSRSAVHPDNTMYIQLPVRTIRCTWMPTSNRLRPVRMVLYTAPTPFPLVDFVRCT